ncbi:MAG: DUF1173 domain-containing protein [Proteobacteria bacterium]|nr:DUF1173 domain-containing protein [Pseudomonadota bacterium]
MIDLNHNILAVSTSSGGVQLRPGDITDTTSFFSRTLVRARNTRGHAICLCTTRSPSDERRLSIKSNDTRLWLARYPNTGAGHAANCVWHITPREQSGVGSYAASVIERDGEISKIQLRFGAKIREAKEGFDDDTGKTHTCGSKRKTKSRMTERGLMDFLWEESNLSLWIPQYKRRSWPMAANQIMAAASKTKWGRQLLSDVLIVANGGNPKNRVDTIAANLSKLTAAVKRKKRILLITELSRKPELRKGSKCVLVPIMSGYADYKFKVFADADLPERLKRRFPIAWNVFGAEKQGREEPARVIALIVCEPKKDPKCEGCFNLNMLDMAIMPVNNLFIPFDSSYEHLLSNRLIKDERTFRKPLRYDDRDCVLPDFELLDVGEKTYPMEVFGMNTEEYNARKREKIIFYNNVYGAENWWSWMPNAEDVEIAVCKLPPVENPL